VFGFCQCLWGIVFKVASRDFVILKLQIISTQIFVFMQGPLQYPLYVCFPNMYSKYQTPNRYRSCVEPGELTKSKQEIESEYESGCLYLQL
jgi:hypothetical protein